MSTTDNISVPAFQAMTTTDPFPGQSVEQAAIPYIEAAEQLFPVPSGDPVSGIDIGYGFQLNKANLPIILAYMGIPAGVIAAESQAIMAKISTESLSNLERSISTIIGQPFSLTQIQAQTILPIILQDNTVPQLDSILRKGGAAYLASSNGPSSEYLALLDLYYSGGANYVGATSKLLTALAAGNRAEAWFQIRYGSNGNNFAGIAKRRFYDAQLFGLFSTSTPSTAEAVQAYEMLTAHRTTIFTYEGIWGVDPDGGVASRGNEIAAANTDFRGTGGAVEVQVQTLAQAFSPAEPVVLTMLAADSPLLGWLTQGAGSLGRHQQIFTRRPLAVQ